MIYFRAVAYEWLESAVTRTSSEYIEVGYSYKIYVLQQDVLRLFLAEEASRSKGLSRLASSFISDILEIKGGIN